MLKGRYLTPAEAQVCDDMLGDMEHIRETLENIPGEIKGKLSKAERRLMLDQAIRDLEGELLLPFWRDQEFKNRYINLVEYLIEKYLVS